MRHKKEIKMLPENDYLGSQAEVPLEKCKPDYEQMIAWLRVKLERKLKLKNALLEYYVGQTAVDKMAELIGELVTSANCLQYDIDKLVEQQEKETL